MEKRRGNGRGRVGGQLMMNQKLKKKQSTMTRNLINLDLHLVRRSLILKKKKKKRKNEKGQNLDQETAVVDLGIETPRARAEMKELVAQNTETGIETGIGTEIGEVVLEERIEMIGRVAPETTEMTEEAVPGVEEMIETKRGVDLVVMIGEEETKICGDMINMTIQIEVVIVDVMEDEMEAVEKETEIVALEVMMITDTMIDNEM